VVGYRPVFYTVETYVRFVDRESSSGVGTVGAAPIQDHHPGIGPPSYDRLEPYNAFPSLVPELWRRPIPNRLGLDP
jgi:hypothetical protein